MLKLIHDDQEKLVSDTTYRAHVLRFLVFCFFYLQFCSVVYLVFYWPNVGVNPSGYFSLQDVLVVSLGNSLTLSLLFLIYGVVHFFSPMDSNEIPLARKVIYLAVLPAVFVSIFLYPDLFSVEQEPLSASFTGVLIYLLRYPSEALSKYSRVRQVFGGCRAAFVYIFVVAAGLVWTIYSAGRDSQRDFEEVGPGKVTVELKGEFVTYPLINKIGHNFVVKSSRGDVMVFPNNEVKYVTYPSGP